MIRSAIALLAVAVLAAGCSEEHPAVGETAGPTTQPTATASDPAQGTVETWCPTRREKVDCLSIPGGRHVVVVRATAGGSSDGLVFWDPGGPGLALPDADAPFAILVPASIRQYDVAFVVEPWIESPPSDTCLTAAAGAGVGVCDMESLYSNEKAIAEAMSVVEGQVGEPIVGAYLQSFGATRSQAVVSRYQGLKWMVLESPGPLPGTAAIKLMSARASAIRKVLVAGCEDVRCNDRTLDQLQTWATRGVPGSATGREIALGVIAMTSLPRQNAEMIERLQTALRTGETPAEVSDELRRLGRTFELRGRSQVAPELIALWADTCPRLERWDALAPSSDPIVDAFAWLFRGCTSDPPRTVARSNDSVPTLLLTGRRDTVVPPAIQGAWQGRLTNASQIQGDEHVWDSSAVTRKVRRWVMAHSK